MKVYVVPSDQHACGHYRLIWPAEILKTQGFNVTILPPSIGSGFQGKLTTLSDGTTFLSSLHVPQDADVMVFQRPAYTYHPQMINIMRQNGIAVVIDMDDDMTCIHPQSAAYNTYHPQSQTPYSWRTATESCKIATLITTSTSALQKIYAQHDRGMVLDNYVPQHYLDIKRSNDYRLLGWSGTVKSHPDDPAVVGNAIDRLLHDGYLFHTIGSDYRVKETFRLSNVPSCTGDVPFLDWPQRVSELYVGIAPLAMTRFNTSKSRLKCIEYMSLGIPWVASPRAEYRRLSRESNCGFLADTPAQWYRMVKQLLVDETLHQSQREAGLAYMQDQTYEKQAWRWAEAWQRAYDIERGKR